jgi:hypothetical protein
MNEFQIKNKQDLLYKQAVVRRLVAESQIKQTQDYNEIVKIVSNVTKDYYLNAGKPMLVRHYPSTGGLPIAEDYNANCNWVGSDITILYEEYRYLADLISDYFNYRQTENTRIRERVNYLTGLCSDFSIMSNVDGPGVTYLKDTFVNLDNIEQDATAQDARAHVATREGVISLGRVSSLNRSIGAEVILVQGNGMAGNYHVVSTTDGVATYDYLTGAHDDPVAILDGNPDTKFEFQAVNISESKKRELKYDLDWCSGAETGDTLRLKLVVDLKDVYDINWITLNPYNPPQSSGKLVVNSIKTSEDGLTYISLYSDRLVLNSELNQVPQTYRIDEIIVDDYVPNKFAGQGVWSFETRPARYVEFILEQPESYHTTIGHTSYFLNNQSRIPENSAGSDTINGPPGEYLTGDTKVTKVVEALDGWRYCIGIRDIGIYSYTYKPKGEVITKSFTTQKPIERVSLHVNEKIPPTFLTEIKKANTWINYFISLDGYEWHPISPYHRRPVGDETQRTQVGSTDAPIFPPKIYEINSTSIPETRQDIYKSYVTTSKPATSVQLKMVLNRPEGLDTLTPLVEDYAIKIQCEV